MYKNVLLTENEIKVLYKVLDHHFNRSFIDTDAEDMKNLHIIKRTLLGMIPTNNTNKHEMGA